MSGWTQPQCPACWYDRNPNRRPIRVLDCDGEQCAFCGDFTHDPIYVRVDPSTVPYPCEEADDD